MTGVTKSCAQCGHAGPRLNLDDYECRKRAPVAERMEPTPNASRWVPRWPMMKAEEWCGEFTAHEGERP